MPETSRIKEVFPYLRCKGAAAAIDFYCKVFGATERFRHSEPGGRMGHAELTLGSTVLMVSEEYPEHGIFSPATIGGTGSAIHLHVDNADDFAARAVAAGATMLTPPTDQFYGERSAKVRDPWGHEWMFGHEIEKVSHAEMQRRFDAMFK